MRWLDKVKEKVLPLWQKTKAVYHKSLEKFQPFVEKCKPVLHKTKRVCIRIGKDTATVCGYMYNLRSILLAIPVVSSAIILAVYNMSRLPTAVQITTVSFGADEANALFGDLVVGVDYISREIAVFGPLILTVGCLLLTFCSKRTLYPWLISIFSLALPVLFLLTNQYPM